VSQAFTRACGMECSELRYRIFLFRVPLSTPKEGKKVSSVEKKCKREVVKSCLGKLGGIPSCRGVGGRGRECLWLGISRNEERLETIRELKRNERIGVSNSVTNEKARAR